MAIKINIPAIKRSVSKKKGAKAVRASGRMPAIIYSAQKEPLSISFDTREFIKLIHGHSYENIIVEIAVQNNGKPDIRKVVIKEVQVDPLKSTLVHVDFHEVSMDKPIQVHVPINFTGTAVGIKEQGGMLDAPVREILIKCLPTVMPDIIEIDISTLRIGDVIHIKDIAIPEGVSVLDTEDKVVASIVSRTKSTEKAAKAEEEQEAEKAAETDSKKIKES
ncbi:MAG: 50S ribosomal protein L25 [bacterium]